MQIIEELEKEPRGVYTGAIGYIAPDGDAVFNVPIRTIHLKGNKGEMGIGAGITHGSVPVEEWHESLLKGRFLTHLQDVFYLFETMVWEKERGYYLLEEHLNRLQRGAEFFKFSCDIRAVKEQLLVQATSYSNPVMRVRLVLKKDGCTSITAVACDLPHYTTLPAFSERGRPVVGTVRLASAVVDAGPYLFHKTSRRAIYDSEFKNAQENRDVEALFLNEKNELTEGCISNLIILKDGEYLTPPVECGLLTGVMRQRLLAAKDNSEELHEKLLLIEDLENAEAVYICNSVRGVVRVKFLA